MEDRTRRDRIRGEVKLGKDEAGRLTHIARHASMKEFVGRAVRDLDEAIAWLGVRDDRSLDAESHWLSFVESIVEGTETRLQVADEILKEHGQSAILIP